MLKKILMLVACSLSVNANAMGNGFYMGIMMGPATNNAPSMQAVVFPSNNPDFPNNVPVNQPFTTTIANPRSSQFASRIYIGNQFNQYAAIEGGGTFFSSIRYDSVDVKTYGSTDQRVRDLDVVFKGILPLQNFSLYVKGGVAVAYVTKGGAFNPEYIPAESRITASTSYKNKFAPTYSVGASYDLDQSWAIDASLNVLQVGDSVGNLSFFGVGFSYHFTNKYCGQFLCDD